ncbi:hypothetical protein ACIRD3_39770 [Kitasatospora sp. NPDC093550]|uniref:hypothetical protein n=1 Tax=Kitasatospora sp. NPDC093550 TaxID=3364089 RepID=UPI00381F8FB0
MVEIPEEQQAATLKALAQVVHDRNKVVAEWDEKVKAAAVTAVKAGNVRTRVRELCEVSPKTLYAWLKSAGLPVRPYKPRSG